MNAGQPVNQERGAGQTIRPTPPPLLAVMWFRLGLGMVACLAMVAVLLSHLGGELAMQMFKMGLVVILAAIGLPSMAVAYGLWKRRRWAPALTLGYDFILLLLVIPGLAARLAEFITGGGYLVPTIAVTSAVASAALVIAAEATHVIKSVWGWRLAWRVYGIAAVGLMLPTIVAPVMASKRFHRHVKPLVAYIDAHWFAIPPGSRVSVESWPDESGGHQDHIHVQRQDIDWFVIAQHLADGRWRFPAAKEQWDYACKGMQHRRGSNITSVQDAQKVLTDSGVADHDLGPGRLVESEDRPDAFEFWSPKGKGFFRVETSGDIILYLKDPLEVP